MCAQRRDSSGHITGIPRPKPNHSFSNLGRVEFTRQAVPIRKVHGFGLGLEVVGHLATPATPTPAPFHLNHPQSYFLSRINTQEDYYPSPGGVSGLCSDSTYCLIAPQRLLQSNGILRILKPGQPQNFTQQLLGIHYTNPWGNFKVCLADQTAAGSLSQETRCHLAAYRHSTSPGSSAVIGRTQGSRIPHICCCRCGGGSGGVQAL